MALFHSLETKWLDENEPKMKLILNIKISAKCELYHDYFLIMMILCRRCVSKPLIVIVIRGLGSEII
jgi:hypothetical protein